jgi:hypothetical protein
VRRSGDRCYYCPLHLSNKKIKFTLTIIFTFLNNSTVYLQHQDKLQVIIVTSKLENGSYANKIIATPGFNKQFISILSFSINTLWLENLSDDNYDKRLNIQITCSISKVLSLLVVRWYRSKLSVYVTAMTMTFMNSLIIIIHCRRRYHLLNKYLQLKYLEKQLLHIVLWS